MNFKPRLNFDPWLLGGLLTLMLIGLVMVFSASAPKSEQLAGHPYHFLLRHAVALFLGLGAMFVVAQIPAHLWRRFGPHILGLSLLLLLLVLIPGVGVEVNGSRRWLDFGLLRFQPSELFKFAIVIFLAGYILRKGQDKLADLKEGIAPLAVLLAVGGGLILIERDLGSLVVVFAIVGGMILIAGMPWRVLLIAGLAAALLVVVKIIQEPYRLARIKVALDPWSDPLGDSFQTIQALIAYGRGGINGVGLGNSVQKLHYLPEAHTDFILAVIGEELGLIGVWIIMALYGLVLLRIYTIARRAELADMAMESLLAYGVFVWFAFQCLANMGVSLGVLPPKGLTLPFISYGGSSLLTMSLGMGLVLGISTQVPKTRIWPQLKFGQKEVAA